jgi:ferredoxin
MTHYRIAVGEHYFNCLADKTVLSAMQNEGFKCIPVGCCGGGCGICKVKVIEGSYKKKIMSREKISIEDEKNGVVLACRIMPTSDLKIERLK